MSMKLRNPHTGMPYTVNASLELYGDEDECANWCDEGRIWNNADPTSGQWVACDACPSGEQV
jgi:hypothetical protein